jgi:hypothetical protein
MFPRIITALKPEPSTVAVATGISIGLYLAYISEQKRRKEVDDFIDSLWSTTASTDPKNDNLSQPQD